MMKEILYINIRYENGIYLVENDEIFPHIPEGILVNTPFYNKENSFEELLDVISAEPESVVVFEYNSGNCKLVNRLARVLAFEWDKQVYLVNEQNEYEWMKNEGNGSIHFIKRYGELEQAEFLNRNSVSEFPGRIKEKRIDNDNGYYVAMRNGYDAFVTGIYPDNMSNTLAKHIQIESVDTIKNVSDFLDINGAFLFEPGVDIDTILDKQECINHIHVVNENGVSFGDTQLQFESQIMSYSEYISLREKGHLNRDIEYYLRVDSVQDMNYLAADLELYRKNGMIETISTRLVDECRWTNQCSLKRLVRYSIVDSEIRPCLTSEMSLGDVSLVESNMQLLEANKACDRTMIRRKCMECTRKDICSKCACLPKDIGQDKYCEFMQQFPYVGEYLLKKRLVNFLGKFSKIFEGLKYLEVSGNGKCFEYESQKEKMPSKRNVFIFAKDGSYYALHLQKGNLIKVESKYVFLMEAWAMEEAIDEVIKSAISKYSVEEDQARHIVETGYAHLKKEGLIL